MTGKQYFYLEYSLVQVREEEDEEVESPDLLLQVVNVRYAGYGR